MIACMKCRIEMLCLKNSVGLQFGEAHVYPSDTFQCPECGCVVAKSNPAPIFDPEHNTQDEYVRMKES